MVRYEKCLSVSDPWGRCLDSGLKQRRGRRGGGEAVVVIKLSLPTLPPPLQHLMIHNMLESELGKVTKMQRDCQSIPILTRFFLLRASPILFRYSKISREMLLHTFYILILLDQKKSKKKGLVPDGAHAVPWELRIFSFTCDTFRVSSEAEEGLRFYSFSTCDSSGGSEKVKQRVPDGAHAVPWESEKE